MSDKNESFFDGRKKKDENETVIFETIQAIPDWVPLVEYS